MRRRTKLRKGRRMCVDWAELPPEIVESISKRLTIYVDYFRFRCVCRSWQSSVPETPLHLPPQPPWLMLSHRGSFFDLSTGKTNLLNLPLSSPRTRICGSSHGWLVILDETPEVRLLNPITRATLFLPPLHTFPNVVSFDYSKIDREYQYLVRNSSGDPQAFSSSQMCNSFLRKVVLSPRPSHSGDFAALAILAQGNLAFCRKGYDSWVFPSESHDWWEDAVYHNGSFFAVSSEGLIAKCDVEGSFPPPLCIIRPAEALKFFGDTFQYVVFSGEDMLLISRALDQEHDMVLTDEEYESNLVFCTWEFEIFKMDWNVLLWEKIDTLGERALCIGLNSSFAFSAADFDGCCANCIYFTDDYSEPDHNYPYGRYDFGIFRLCDESDDESIVERLPYPGLSYSRFEWPLPVWITPNPC